MNPTARADSYEVVIGRNLLEQLGNRAARVLPAATRVAVVSNRKVSDLYAATVTKSLKGAGLRVARFLTPDGERYKTWRTAARILDFLSAERFERGDALIMLGGGVVTDVGGFVASIYLRGIRHINVPTTLLAQIDASIGGKTGVNTTSGKNLVGSFHNPRAVFIDTNTLATLPQREVTAGLCEMVKQAAIGGVSLFEQTETFLSNCRDGSAGLDSDDLKELITSHCDFKRQIVEADPFEKLDSRNIRSRKVLNFGHTTAHALEKITNFRRFRHGEAVGYGLIVAAEISKRLGLLDDSELESLSRAVRFCGHLPSAMDIDPTTLTSVMAHDKKRAGGRITWVLLEGFGQTRLIDQGEIPRRILIDSLKKALKNS